VFEDSIFEAKASGLRGQWSLRPRPEVSEAKAKDLEAKVEASDLCDEGQSSMGCTKSVESTDSWQQQPWLPLCQCMYKIRNCL